MRIDASVDEYMARPYSLRLWYDAESEAWICEADELEGCVAHGATSQEAADHFIAAKRVWFRAALSNGIAIPEPRAGGTAARTQFSGRILLRLPRNLHEALAKRAGHQNVSLNQYATAALARIVGADEVRDLCQTLAEGYRQIAHAHAHQEWAWASASRETRGWTTNSKLPVEEASTYLQFLRNPAEAKAFSPSAIVAEMYGDKATEDTRH